MNASAPQEPTPQEVLLGLGANLGEPIQQLVQAVRRLRALLGEVAVSPVYRTEPVGYLEQPDFFNLVARTESSLEPHDLLAALQQIEREMGRERPFADAPRTIDIDLLGYGDVLLATPALTLPHPRLHQRAFVLAPLAELAPGWRHPRLGRSAGELLRDLGPAPRVERWGPLPQG